jgi:Protein involved in formate dehydrogenase formation
MPARPLRNRRNLAGGASIFIRRLYNPAMPESAIPRPTRSEPREVMELKSLKITQPDLASAIDMQIALLDMQRRVQSRVPLPWIETDAAWLQSQYAAGRAVVRFSNIPIDWSDLRLTLRQTTDILRRFDALEPDDYRAILDLGRSRDFESLVRRWYEESSGVNGGGRASRTRHDEAQQGLDQVLVLALRPFLVRCAEVLMQRTDAPAWTHGHCPYCGWDPDFSLFTRTGERRLICGRCLAQWAFDASNCPFCANSDRSLIVSFATPDGRYRVYACNVCRRYLKAYDARTGLRPIMVGLDTIATLPLDAAAIQRGYIG